MAYDKAGAGSVNNQGIAVIGRLGRYRFRVRVDPQAREHESREERPTKRTTLRPPVVLPRHVEIPRGVEERQHHSLTLKKTSEDPSCEAIGMHVFNEEDLDKAKSHFDKIGIASQFIEVPFQRRTLRRSTPSNRATSTGACPSLSSAIARWRRRSKCLPLPYRPHPHPPSSNSIGHYLH